MTDEQIKRLYNSFPEGQTMPFHEFRKAIKDANDPVKMRQDLAEIQMQKAIFNTNKIRVDRALN